MRLMLVIVPLVFLISCDRLLHRIPSSEGSGNPIGRRSVNDPLPNNAVLLNLTSTSLKDIKGVELSVTNDFRVGGGDKDDELIVDLAFINSSTTSYVLQTVSHQGCVPSWAVLGMIDGKWEQIIAYETVPEGIESFVLASGEQVEFESRLAFNPLGAQKVERLKLVFGIDEYELRCSDEWFPAANIGRYQKALIEKLNNEKEQSAK